jgi:hypothetical protein
MFGAQSIGYLVGIELPKAVALKARTVLSTLDCSHADRLN